MSRSGYGYSDLCDDDPLADGRWRGAVKRATEGARGQAMLRELAQALDTMPDKRLYPGSFTTPEGQFCALGALGAQRGTKMDDLGDEDDCSPKQVGQRFGIAPALAAEIMFLNDESLDDAWLRAAWGEDAPQKRWQFMRKWVTQQLKTEPAAEEGKAP
jgi:hypothetical protein